MSSGSGNRYDCKGDLVLHPDDIGAGWVAIASASVDNTASKSGNGWSAGMRRACGNVGEGRGNCGTTASDVLGAGSFAEDSIVEDCVFVAVDVDVLSSGFNGDGFRA